MTLGLAFLSFMFAYWWKNYILNFKKLISFTLRDTLKRTPKVISNQNLLCRFQSWCWFWCWSWCWNLIFGLPTVIAFFCWSLPIRKKSDFCFESLWTRLTSSTWIEWRCYFYCFFTTCKKLTSQLKSFLR